MAGQDVIRSYLVELGWEIDDTSFKKFEDYLARTKRSVLELGAAFTGVVATVGEFTSKMSEHWSDLYYQSQRLNDTIKNIQAAAFAGSQIGIPGSQMRNLLEQIGEQRRFEPYMQPVLQHLLGVRPGVSTTDQMKEELAGLRRIYMQGPQGHMLADIYRQQFTPFSREQLSQYIDNPDAFLKSFNEYQRRATAAGMGTQAQQTLGREAVETQRNLNQLKSDAQLSADVLAKDFMPAAVRATHALDQLADTALKLNAQHGDIGTTAGGVLGAGAAGATAALTYSIGKNLLLRLGPGGAKVADEAGNVVRSGSELLGEKVPGAVASEAPSLLGRIAGFANPVTAFLGALLGDPARGNVGEQAYIKAHPELYPNAYPHQPSLREEQAYIEESAKRHGIDPATALAVARSEGLGRAYAGDYGSSFGPFQLHMGGLSHRPGMAGPGLGDEFHKETGLDPRDPNTWKQQIDFALSRASEVGWGPWHGFKGSQWAGLGASTHHHHHDNRQSNVTFSPTNNITVTGTESPQETGKIVSQHVNRTQADMLRNFKTVTDTNAF